MELDEFHRILTQGHSWKDSAFLSAYFSLVGYPCGAYSLWAPLDADFAVAYLEIGS